jgi:N-acetylglucosamine-6-sulfatase
LEAFERVVRNRLADRLSRWSAVIGVNRIAVGGSPVLLVMALILLFGTAGTALFVQPPSDAEAQRPGADASESSLLGSASVVESIARPASDRRPNIVVIYLDDMRVSDLKVMHNVNRLLRANGVTFSNSVVSTASCCPARATTLTGQYAHNTGVRHNAPPFGGYAAFKFGKQAAGETIPVWLERAGYRTVFFGKYMNHYPHEPDKYEVPPGFTDWYGLFEAAHEGRALSIYRQTRYGVRVQARDDERSLLDGRQAKIVFDMAPYGEQGDIFLYEGEETHQTEVLMDGAVNLFQRNDGSEPLYLSLWLTAPHAGGDGPVIGGKNYPVKHRPVTTMPAAPELARLQSLLEKGSDLGELGLEQSPAFNERDVTDKPPAFRSLPRLTPRDVKDIEIRNALRLASLQSVDRRIPDLLAAIHRADARTGRQSYIVFSSDNGFFLGEQRMAFEKNWHYGVSTDVPLIITGPGVVPNATVEAPVANIDLAPTILQMAGVVDTGAAQIDGRSLMPLLEYPDHADASVSWDDRALLLEGFTGRTRNFRYAAVRTKSYVYVEHYAHGDGTTVEFTELYDRKRDPSYEKNLLHGTVSPESQAVAWRLATLLDDLKSCAGEQCQQRERAMGVDPTPQPAPSQPSGTQPTSPQASRSPQIDPQPGARSEASPRASSPPQTRPRASSPSR